MKTLMKHTFLIVILSVTLFSCREKIDGGNEGVLVDQYGSGKGQGVSLVAGSTWYNPFTQDVFQFPLYVQNADYQGFAVTAKDGSAFTVDPRVTYKIQNGHAPDIFRKYRRPIEEIQETVINTYTRDAFRVIFGRYSTDYILSNQNQLDDLLTKTLSDAMDKDGFHLEQLTYSLVPPKSIVDAINSKNQEIAKAMQAENQLKTAEARAKIKIVEAEAEAKANELRQRTLTPLLVQQQFIEKWNGATPLYGNSPTMFKNVD